MSKDIYNISEAVQQSRPIDMSEPYDPAWVGGKTIVITGGASGFGEGFFRIWGENGATVIIGDVSDTKGQALVEEVRKSSGNPNLHYVHCDVANWQSQVDFFREAVRLSPTGGIDAVVANAGVTDNGVVFDKPPETIGTLEEPPAPDFKCIQVNLIGLMYTAHLGIYHLQKNPSSAKASKDSKPAANTRDRHLLLVGSIASLGAIPAQAQYTSSKHAVLGLFRSLRSTSFLRGIRVNMILPYFIYTPIISVPGRLILAGGAMGKPEDVVDAGTRLMADTRIVGRALAIGPRVRVNDDWQVLPDTSTDGEEKAIWEPYAEDFTEAELFTRRFIGMLNQVERVRGWYGWASDIILAFRYGFKKLISR